MPSVTVTVDSLVPAGLELDLFVTVTDFYGYVTDTPIHENSLRLMNCGASIMARPSIGAWITYGLGTENSVLPAFVSLSSGADSGSRSPTTPSGKNKVTAIKIAPRKNNQYSGNATVTATAV